MNALDILIAALVLLATLYGLLRGFVRISFGIAGLALTLVAALRFADQGANWFAGTFTEPRLAHAAAFAVICCAGLLATGLVILIVRKLLAVAQLSWIDRLLGGLVGGAGATLCATALLVAGVLFLPAETTLIKGSRFASRVMGIADVAALVLPQPLFDIFQARRHPPKGEPLDETARR